jgi:hypothetical protein
MHTDNAFSAGADALVASAQARNVPIISARQMLDWTDGRDRSSFASVVWNGNAVNFTVRPDPAANGLEVILPLQSRGGTLSSLKRGATVVPYTVKTIKGVDYASFTAVAGVHTATYAP